ncbi:MAG TPA: hypothetical protein VF342_08230 [Alphaproteobacteria bacterium]
MRRGTFAFAVGLFGFALAACTADAQQTSDVKAPPGGEYKKVSTLVPLPEFIPGLGTLYVQPSTLPAGPFLAYDRDGRLVSTIYMVPIKDMEARKAFNDLAVGSNRVDHVDFYYNAGHPGVAEPHYHVVLWHIPAAQEASLK